MGVLRSTQWSVSETVMWVCCRSGECAVLVKESCVDDSEARDVRKSLLPVVVRGLTASGHWKIRTRYPNFTHT